jgi:Xaa-Pro aminopeptidase
MTSNFSSDFFVGNRRRLRELVKPDMPIVITANGMLQRGGDCSYAFQQDASFWYLTGISEPEIILVMGPSGDYLMVPPRESVREAFDGAVDDSDLTKRSGIEAICDLEAGWKQLRRQLRTAKRYATAAPNPAYVEFWGMYTNPARASLVQKITDAAGDSEQIDIRKDIARLRMVKQKPELRALQQAIDITIDSMIEATGPDRLAAYQYEYELDAAIACGFRKRGARGNAFEPIVASGKNAATIHSMSNNGRMKNEDLIVADVGAEYDGYCADITRTYSIGGQPSERQQAVHAAVLAVQEYGYSLLKPGVLLREYEKQIETYMGERLLDLKLIRTADKDAIRTYYPHACSHFLGLDPHDAGDYEQALEPGTVLTCEPGIYIPEEGIGVRIEDDVVITASGIKVLSRRLPKTLM